MDLTTIYAFLSAAAYDDARLSINNRAPIPHTWTRLDRFERSGSGALAEWSGDGFSAAVFQGPLGQIVISFAGTEFRPTDAGLTADFLSGNVPLAVGGPGSQAFAAAKLYLEVQHEFGANANITFTGHSLGGGLAGLMGVLFDRPATVFAPAPFELAAINGSPALFSIKIRLAELGLDDEKLNQYNYFRDFATRESRVASHAISGEILELIPAIVPRIEGYRQRYLVGVPSQLGGGDRHSIDLHAALILSQSFRVLAESLPELLPVLFDKSQYGFEVLANVPNLLMRLIRGEVGFTDPITNQFIAPNGLLTKFSTDLAQIVAIEDLEAESPLRRALVSAASERYYLLGPAATNNFFDVSGNGIHFKLNQLGVDISALKSTALLADLISENEAVEFGIPEAIQTALRAQAWHIHTSSAPVIWTDTDGLNDVALGGSGADNLDGGEGRDLLLGGAGDDNLKGGAGNDKIFGDAGDDTLDGGSGADELYGSIGTDTYNLKLGELGDVIIDIDGNGKIIVSGTQLIGGKKIADGYWISADSKWTYTLTLTGDLKITSTTVASDFINVRDWANATGKLGIQLAQTIEAPTVQWNQLSGDYQVAIANASSNVTRIKPDGAGVIVVQRNTPRFTQDATGNLAAGVGILVTDNALFGGAGRDKIDGLTGNDLIGGFAGDDELYGGAGNDMIGGGTGADRIFGGDGNDYISSASNPYRASQANGPNDQWINWGLPEGRVPVVTGQNFGVYAASVSDQSSKQTWSGMGDPDQSSAFENGDYVDGGAGDDHIIGSWANDVLVGGTGDDKISGLGGDDFIQGGDGKDYLRGDGLTAPDYLETLPYTKQGNDVIEGGAGDDVIIGGGLADQLYGGDGDDQISGDDKFSDAKVLLPISVHGNDYIEGGAGADIVDGGGGDDTIFGGTGDDLLVGDYLGYSPDLSELNLPSSYGNDYLDGEDGKDTLFGGGGSDELFGGSGDDVLFGDRSPGVTGTSITTNYLHGSSTVAGDDYMDGEAGKDYLVGDQGNDHLEGGADDDFLVGDFELSDLSTAGIASSRLSWGNDYLNGDTGNDVLLGGGGADTLYGGTGNDFLGGDDASGALDILFHGKDVLFGEEGDDVLAGGGDSDQLDGGAGDDIIMADSYLKTQGSTHAGVGNYGNDQANGGDGNDQIWMEGGSDYASGGEGDDLIFGDQGALSPVDPVDHGSDVLNGDGGNDMIFGDGGDDQLFGGSGNDSLFGDDATLATSSYRLEERFHGKDTLSGGSGDDFLVGGGASDRLDGGEGNDILWGDGRGISAAFSGNDILLGGGGNDILIGDAGADTLDGGEGNDVLFGDDITAIDSQYTLDGAVHGADVLTGGGGNDQLVGGGGSDRLDGGEGNDLLIGDGEGLDSRFQGNDVLIGGAGDDRLFGNGGNDTLDGGSGEDYLSGGAGDDILIAGTGGDYLLGGDGFDTYVIDLASAKVGALGVNTPNGIKNQITRISDSDGLYRLQLNGIDPALVRVENIPQLGGMVLIFAGTITEGPGGALTASADAAAVVLEGVNRLNVTRNRIVISNSAGVTQSTQNLAEFVVAHRNTFVGAIGSGGNGGTDTQPTNILGSNSNDFINVDKSGTVVYAGAGNDDFQISSGVANTTIRLSSGDGYDLLSGYGGKVILQLDASLNLNDVRLRFVRSIDTTSGGSGQLVEDLYLMLSPTDTQGVKLQDAYKYLSNYSGGITVVGFDGQELSLASLFDKGVTVNLVAGGDTIYGSSYNEQFLFTSGAQTVYGGAGNDTYVPAGPATIRILDAEGDNILRMPSNVSLSDVITSRVDGTNDVLLELPGGVAITLASGLLNAGRWTLQFSSTDGPVNVPLSTLWSAVPAVQVDGLGSADSIHGSAGTDLLRGFAGDDELRGFAGADVLDGGDGNDTLVGGIGNDKLIGGDGKDTYVFAAGDGMDEIIDAQGQSKIILGAGLTLAGMTVQGELLSGKLTLSWASGQSISIWQGYDTAQFELVFANGAILDNYAVHALIAEAPRTIVDDQHYGAVLVGGSGNDLLTGGDGDDTLRGFGGNDLLTGGSGSDTYLFGINGGVDTIDDNSGVSVLQFEEGIALANFVTTRVVINGIDYWQLGYSASDSVRVRADADLSLYKLVFANGTTTTWNELLLETFAGPLVLTGTSSADNLSGSAGNDTLIGAAGFNELKGGRGNDTYVVGATGEFSAIKDTEGVNTVQWTGTGPSLANSRRIGNDLVLTDSNGQSSTLIREFYTSASAWQLSSGQGANVDLRAWVSNLTSSVLPDARRERFFDSVTGGLNSLKVNGVQLSIGTQTTVQEAYGNRSVYNLSRDRRIVNSNAAAIVLNATSQQTTAEVQIGSTTNTVTSIVGYNTSTVTRQQYIEPRSYLNYVRETSGANPILGSRWVTNFRYEEVVVPGRFETVTREVRTPITQTVTTTRPTYEQRVQVQLVTQDLRAGAGDNQITLSGASALVDAGAGNDTIIRTANGVEGQKGDWLFGGAGDDRNVGGIGNDELLGGVGRDYLNGGEGSDTYVIDRFDTGWDTVNDTGDDAFEVVILGGFYGTLNGSLAQTLQSIAVSSQRYNYTSTGDGTYPANSNYFGREVMVATVLPTSANIAVLYQLDRAAATSGSGPNTYSNFNQALVSAKFDQLILRATGVDQSDRQPWQSRLYASPNQLSELATASDTIQLIGVTAAELSVRIVREQVDGVLKTLLYANWADGNVKFVVADDVAGNAVGGQVNRSGIEFVELAGNQRLSVRDLLQSLPPSQFADERGAQSSTLTLNLSALEDVSFLQSLTFQSALAGAQRFTLEPGSNKPSWLNIDSATGSLIGLPTQADVGNTAFTIVAEYRNAPSRLVNVNLRTLNSNDAPLVTGPIAALRIANGQNVSWNVSNSRISDQDPGDRLTYSVLQADGRPLPTWLRFNPVTGELMGTPPLGTSATLELSITATDLAGAKISNPLQIVLLGGTTTYNLVNEAIRINEDTSSVSGNIFSNDELPTLGQLRVQGSAQRIGQYGVLSINEDGSFQYIGNTNDLQQLRQGQTVVETFAIDVRNSDALNAPAKTSQIVITIDGLNDAPVALQAPVALTVTAGNRLSAFVDARNFYDKDVGDKLSFQLSAAQGQSVPQWLAFDPNTLRISGTPPLTANTPLGQPVTLRLVATDSFGAAVEVPVSIVIAAQTGITLQGTINADTLTGAALADRLFGGDGNDLLTGGAGDDYLDGGLGVDRMRGQTGNDTYVVADVGDVVEESVNQGNDLVLSSITYTLPVNVEALELLGTADLDATGNSGDNDLIGNAGANRLTGGSGIDRLVGAAGDDHLRGGTGADLMWGGVGNDLYEVDNIGDLVIEQLNEGNDTVESSVTYTLTDHVENLILTGAIAINGTGNALDNVLNGNSADNILVGGAGNDVLAGGLGNDTLRGGDGNDVYMLEDDVDTIIETANGGIDVVISRFNITLSDNVENGVLMGAATILTGNLLNNVLTGNAGANIIDGGVGDDTMIGGKGNDTYVIDSKRDVITELAGEGTDSVKSSVNFTLGDNIENLELTGTAEAGMGNSLANILFGNDASNKLWGEEGNDTLDGGKGADILFGGAGNDLFYVDSIDDLVVELNGEGTDRIISTVSYKLPDFVENLTLAGTDAINAIGNDLNNILEGNSAANILFGGLGSDTYKFGIGSGKDTIVNFDSGSPSADKILFGANVTQANLSLARTSNDLIISINSTQDSLTVANYFLNNGTGANRLESIRFADGSTWTYNDVVARTTVNNGLASSTQGISPAVLNGDASSLWTAANPAATKVSDSTSTPVTTLESIVASRARFEAGLRTLRTSTDESNGVSRAALLEASALPLLWRLQDALLQVQISKNAGSRFSADVSLDSRLLTDLTAATALIGSRQGPNGRLDAVNRSEYVQQFRLAQLDQ